MGRKSFETTIIFSLLGVAVLSIGFSTFAYGDANAENVSGDLSFGNIVVEEDSSRYLLPLKDEENLVTAGFSLDLLQSTTVSSYFSVAIPVTFSASYWRLTNQPNFTIDISGFSDAAQQNLALLVGVTNESDIYTSCSINLSTFAFDHESLFQGSLIAAEGFNSVKEGENTYHFPSTMQFILEDSTHFSALEGAENIYLNLHFSRNGYSSGQTQSLRNFVSSLINTANGFILELKIHDVTGESA